MARLRNNLRRSIRFGGNGAEYDIGYQFKNPQREPIVFGPWERLMPYGRRMLPPTALAHLRDGLLVDGMILPMWLRSSVPVADVTVVGTFDLNLLLGSYHVIFYLAEGDEEIELFIELRSTTATTIISTEIETTTREITCEGWNNTIYFGFPGAAHFWGYDIVSTVLAEITDGPPASFLFALDNNLCALVFDGIWQMYWCVDGDPTDWSGYGAGAEIVPGSVGAVMGYAKMDKGVLVCGRDNGWFMQSTNAIPSFRFEEDNRFPGVGFYGAVLGAQDVAYFVKNDKTFASYQRGGTVDVGFAEGLILIAPHLYHSKTLNAVIVSSKEPAQTLFLNLDSKQWFSDLPFRFTHVTDSPFGAAEHGSIIGIVQEDENDVDEAIENGYERVTLDLVTDDATMPTLTTGMLRFEQPLLVSYIDIEHNDLIEHAPLLDVRCLMPDGTIITISFGEHNRNDIQIHGPLARYFVDITCYGIELTTNGLQVTEGFYDAENHNATGNYVSDGQSAEGMLRGNFNGQGNIIPVADGLYTFGPVNTAGNQEMITGQTLWPIEVGLDRIKLFVRSTQHAPDVGGR